LQEKISTFITKHQYSRALEYLSIALASSPEDTTFRIQRAFCYIKTLNYDGAMHEYDMLLEKDAIGISDKINLLELYCILGKREQFAKVFADNKVAIENSARLPSLIAYLHAASAYFADDHQELIRIIRQYLPTHKPEYLLTPSRWDFSDVLSALNQRPASPDKVIFTQFITVLQGALNPTEFKKTIATQ